MNEQEFRKELQRNQKKDYHVKFFQDDPNRDHITIPLFSKIGPKAQIIPFRNTACTNPSCVYGLEDLVQKFRESNYSTLHGFMCYSCNKFIFLKSFFLDYTLKKIIDEIFQKHNTPDKIICKRVTIMRDGHWEPNLPEYLKYLHKNMRVSLGVEDSQNLVKPSDGDYEIKTIVEYENPPALSEFSKDELKDILQTFKEAKIKDQDLFFERDGIPLLVEDVRKLESDDTTSHRTITMFVYYLNLLQRVNKMKYNRSNGNRCYYAAINLLSYDRFYKAAKYQYFFGFRNHFLKNPSQIYNEYDKCIFIFKHDGRWIVLTVELATNCFYIADFLSEDLSHSKFDELLEIAKAVAVNEYKLRYSTHEFYDAYKLNFYNDCGIYVLTYMYKALNNDSMETIKVQPKEKELFRQQLVWLFLRMKLLRKKEIQMMPFPNLPDQNSLKKSTRNNDSMTHMMNSNGKLELVSRSPRIPTKRDDDDTHSTLSILKELDKNPNLSIPDIQQQNYNFSSRPQQNQNPYQQQQPYQIPTKPQTRNASMILNNQPHQDKETSILEFKKDELQNLLEQFKQDLIDKIDVNKKRNLNASQDLDDSMRSSRGMQKNQKGGYPQYPPNPYQNPYMNPYQQPYPNPYQTPYQYPNNYPNPYMSPYTNPQNQQLGYPSYDVSDYSSVDESSVNPSVLLGKKPKLKMRDDESVFDTEKSKYKTTKSITTMSDDDDEDSRITDLRDRLSKKAQQGMLGIKEEDNDDESMSAKRSKRKK